MGRKKIKIQPIQDERNKQVTFLKRKHGLMKKAYELSVLCNCEIALLIFNTSGKLIQYASSDIDQIMMKYTEYTDLHETKSNQDFINNDDVWEEGDETIEHEPETHTEKDQSARKEKTPPAPHLIPRPPVVMTQQESHPQVEQHPQQNPSLQPPRPPLPMLPFRTHGDPSYAYVPPPATHSDGGYDIFYAINPTFVPHSQFPHQGYSMVPPYPQAPSLPPSQPYTVNYSPVINGVMATPTPHTIPVSYHQQPLAQEQLTPGPPQQRQLPPQEQSVQIAHKRAANLRVEIPQNDEHAESQQKPSEQQPPPSASFPPPSALPSQFAYNLPSPSTFYPEFYTQHNDLPSPLYFATTPVAGTSFYWPSRNPSISGPSPSSAGVVAIGVGSDYKSSPLAKRNDTKVPTTAHSASKRNHSSMSHHAGGGTDPKKSKLSG
ncbi:unnamed protein product [Mucor circinelloides]